MSDLSRAYSRGYNAANKRSRFYIEKIVSIARAYRARLRTTERERFGDSNWMSRTCAKCARWTRGGPKCQWGFCGQNFMTEVGEPAMWIEDGPEGKIATMEDFGCVNWLHPDNPLRKPFK